MKHFKAYVIFILLLIIASIAYSGSKIDSLLQLYNNCDVEEVKLDLCIELSSEYKFSNLDSSRYFALQTIEISDELGKLDKLGEGYNLLGVTYYFQSINDSAFDLFNLAAKIFREQNNTKELARVTSNIGLIYDELNNDSMALFKMREAFMLYKSINDSASMGDVYINIGNFYYFRSVFDSSLFYLNAALEIFLSMEHAVEYQADVRANLGNLYYYLGDNKLALENYIFAEKIYDSVKNPYKTNLLRELLSNVYEDMEFYDKALEYRYEVMEFYKKQNNKTNLSNVYINMGNLHDYLKQVDSAMYYYKMAADYFLLISDSNSYSYTLHNIGVMLENNGNYKFGIEYLEKALGIRTRINEEFGMASTLQHLGDVYRKLGNFKKSEEYFEKSHHLARKLGAKEMQYRVDFSYAQTLAKLGKYARSTMLFMSAFELRDSVHAENKQRIILEMNTLFETGKMEQEIERQKNEIEKSEALFAKEKAEGEAKSAQRNLFIVAFVMMLILVFIAIRNIRNKKRANLLLTKQNDEIIQKNEEITAQRDEIEAQRDEIVSQRDKLQVQKSEIEDSIRYAKRIQNAVLPDKEYANSILGEHFIIFRPKDVVSGDFYWATQIYDWTIAAVADCTGHGVPGAFMSMLGVSFLNEIVRKNEVINVALILDSLRSAIIEALKQKDKVGNNKAGGSPQQSFTSVKDGLDISIIAIHKDKQNALWAGANNPLYHIRSSTQIENVGIASSETPALLEVKGDNMPIAIYERMDKFTLHKVDIKKGDCLYLFSDGYPDQFGGPSAEGKKFKSGKFKKLLAENANLPMSEQQNVIEKTLDNWINYNGMIHEQVDDITILGLKI